MAIDAQYKRFFLCIVFLLCLTSSFSQEATVSMKEYIDMQAQINKEWSIKFIDAQVQNINDNVSKANQAMEKRLDGINEFRGQLKDQAATFITRGELFAWVFALLGAFFSFNAYMRGKAGASEGKNIVSGDKVEVKK